MTGKLQRVAAGHFYSFAAICNDLALSLSYSKARNRKTAQVHAAGRIYVFIKELSCCTVASNAFPALSC